MNAVVNFEFPSSGPLWSCSETQQRLARFNRKRLRPGHITHTWVRELREESDARLLEGDFVEEERRTLGLNRAAIPTGADEFMRWFEQLKSSGEGQNDPLFPWLAESADLEQMRWFLKQEIAGEAGFDDLVALTQLRFPLRPKLEMARNYWDEMGRGHARGMHGPMLEKVARELRLKPTMEETLTESLALGNMMTALAANRRYAYQSVGALGVIEMTAPGRVSLINAGLKRLRVSSEARTYFQLHAGLDVRHSQSWNREVIRPLVEAEPSAARAIGEGALLRLRCGARCFERYRAEFSSIRPSALRAA